MPIEMRDQLPRYPEDEVPWLLDNLRRIEPCTIADLCRALGIEPRTATNAPSPRYNRVYDIVRQAKSDGLVDRVAGRHSWRVVAGSPAEKNR